MKGEVRRYETRARLVNTARFKENKYSRPLSSSLEMSVQQFVRKSRCSGKKIVDSTFWTVFTARTKSTSLTRYSTNRVINVDSILHWISLQRRSHHTILSFHASTSHQLDSSKDSNDTSFPLAFLEWPAFFNMNWIFFTIKKQKTTLGTYWRKVSIRVCRPLVLRNNVPQQELVPLAH
jgi:hypothetical protein